MNDAINPKVAAERARDTYRKTAAQFQELAGNTEVSEAGLTDILYQAK
jgi:hypothetical protein